MNRVLQIDTSHSLMAKHLCEKQSTFMKYFSRFKSITTGYLFPDLLNCNLNISVYKDLIENGGQTVNKSGFFLMVSNFGRKKKNIAFRLTCYFLPWVK